ncbi:25490_t:CDS:2 [Gigaspora margarita]|uniref:25490_t:CDS:1 n=1 Tax=Gigaspora margarita TaxID=4874 RepID=A0ABN7VJI0_GIGMA|nr:25490_t:CDS:2 [Gigaspora margarita]
MNSESTYYELLANTILPKWNILVNEIDTLYENNQFEFDPENQNENNFVVNSEAYQKEFQIDATFYEWDYANDRLDTLYTKHNISNNLKNSNILRYTTVCEHFGQPKMTKSKDLKKETTTKQIGCMWQKNIAFTKEITDDVKFFVTKMNCSLQQIYKALEEKYFVKVYIPILQQVIQRFRSNL